jgi:ABC-type antimicrobial peptide transport system permease subunit
MLDLLNQYKALVDGIKLFTIFGMIALDLLLGIILALLSKTFDWTKLADFLDTDILKLVAGYYAVGFAALMEPTLVIAVLATWILLEAKLIADVVIKLEKLGVAFKK